MGALLSILARNPITAALVAIAILFAVTAGYQKLENTILEGRLSGALGTISELRGEIALHHAEAESLTDALTEQTARVGQWQAEAAKRSQAANNAAIQARNAALEAESRIALIRAGTTTDCSTAVNQVREALGI